MIKLRNLAPAMLLALAPAAALADDFRFEVEGAFDRGTPTDDFGDFDTTSLSGRWYFAPVSTDGRPLVEAAFLGRASGVSVTVADFDVFDTSLDGVAASVGYYIPGTMLYVEVGADRREYVIGLSSTLVLTERQTSWSGAIGIAPLDGLLITTGLREHGYDPNLTARYVGELPNDHFYAGSVSIFSPEDGGRTSYGIDFDYYLDRTFSLGIGYQSFSRAGGGFYIGEDRWEVRAEKFFSKSWAAGISANTADGSNGFGVHVTWRH